MSKPYVVLRKPLTGDQIAEQVDDDGYLSGVVPVHLNELFELSFEGFVSIVSTALIGNDLLQDISYDLVGHDENELHIEIHGDASAVLGQE